MMFKRQGNAGIKEEELLYDKSNLTVAIIELLLTDDSKFSLIHVSDVCAFMQMF